MGAIQDEKVFGIKLRESANDGSDFSNPEADYRVVFLGEDGDLHARDSAGGVTTLGGGGGGIDEGTSFPGSPATGALFHRTDLTIPLWRFDGTRWRCTCLHEATAGAYDTTAASVVVVMPPFDEAGLDVWAIDAIFGSAVINGTHDGSNHYAFDIFQLNANGSGGTGASIASTTSHAIGTGLNNLATLTDSIGAVVDVSATPTLALFLIEVGATGQARLWAKVRYQYIAT